MPVMARIDGRSFSKFTKGLQKPYDTRFSSLMIDVTKYLVDQTNACCGYTQSDEITLAWKSDSLKSQIFFDGKLLKMVSITASMATARFNKLLSQYLPEKEDSLPMFDSRVWEVPSSEEAANNLIWREMDAVRNSIQGAARSVYSHKQCDNKNSSELQEMLWQKGINWNDYPDFFKRGTYVRKKCLERKFTAEEISSLPPKHHARTDPSKVIKRTIVVSENLPRLASIKNRVDVVLNGKDPITE